MIIHSAGWLEGGLSVSYERIVMDVEVLNMVAQLCAGAKAGATQIGFSNALSQVAPTGYLQNRDDVLGALLEDWETRNTASITQECALPAANISQAALDFFRCFLNDVDRLGVS